MNTTNADRQTDAHTRIHIHTHTHTLPEPYLGVLFTHSEGG